MSDLQNVGPSKCRRASACGGGGDSELLSQNPASKFEVLFSVWKFLFELSPKNLRNRVLNPKKIFARFAREGS